MENEAEIKRQDDTKRQCQQKVFQDMLKDGGKGSEFAGCWLFKLGLTGFTKCF